MANNNAEWVGAALQLPLGEESNLNLICIA
jgi:hypothetical protein